MRKKGVGVLVSGGLDSAVMVADLARRGRTVTPIYIRQGLAWESVELYWLKKFLAKISLRFKLCVFSLPMGDVYGEHWSTGAGTVPGSRSPDEAVFLPGRNMTLSLKAAVYCSMNGISDLAIGSLGHNPFPDASPSFFRSWSRLLSRGLGHPIRLSAPFRHLTKAQVIARGRALPLELSFSCISPKGKHHCGICNKCVERRRAFKAAKAKDLTRYLRHDRLKGDRFAVGHRFKRSKGGDGEEN